MCNANSKSTSPNANAATTSETAGDTEHEPLTDRTRGRDDEDPPRKTCSAPLALTSDGRVVINMREIAGRDIAGREIFEGVVLDPFETRFAMEGLDDAVAGIAGHIAGRMPKDGDDSGSAL